MNPLIDSLEAIARRGSAELLVWSGQALVLLACVWLVIRIYGKKSSALRHQIWLFGMIAVAMLPLGTTIIARLPVLRPASSKLSYIIEAPRLIVGTAPQAPDHTLPAEHAVQASPASFVKDSFRFSVVLPWLLAVWAMGVLLALARLLKSHIELRRTLRCSKAVCFADLGCAESEALVTGRVSLRLSPDVQSPVLFGVFRATILFPADITVWTTPSERRAMIQHELAHVQRWDPLINLFQTALRVVFFFHPLVRYACRQLSLEREMACDDRVVAMGAAAEAYAEGILKVAERSLAPASAHQLALFSAKQNLERRIDMILSKDRVRIIARQWKYLVVPTGLIALVAWLLIPVSTAKSGVATQHQNTRSKVALLVDKSTRNVDYPDQPEGEAYKVLLVARLGDNKAYDDLVQMALQNPDAELRRLAAVRLTELEGDGSTGALTELYDKSNDPVVKRMVIDTLARTSEIEPLTKIALADQATEYGDRALARIKWLKETSDSGDIKAWDVSALQDRLNKLPEQAAPPSPPPPLTIPLPAEVTGLRRVAFIGGDRNKVLLDAKHPGGDGTLSDVTVRIPGFTFKAAKALAREGWIYLVDRFEIEHDGQMFYASGSMLIRMIPGGMVSDEGETSIECWFTSQGGIYRSPAREGAQVSFPDLLPD